MEYPSFNTRLNELRQRLKEEQEKYIQAILSGAGAAEVEAIRSSIALLQKQLDSIGGGYTGL